MTLVTIDNYLSNSPFSRHDATKKLKLLNRQYPGLNFDRRLLLSQLSSLFTSAVVSAEVELQLAAGHRGVSGLLFVLAALGLQVAFGEVVLLGCAV